MNPFPLISVRDFIIFPGSQMSLQIGRSFTIASIKEAIANFEGRLVITSQKSIEMNDRPSLEQIFKVGCLCKITNMVEFPDGSMKIMAEGQRRFQIETLEDLGGVRYCSGAFLGDRFQAIPAQIQESIRLKIVKSKDDWPKDFLPKINSLQSSENSFKFVMGVGHLLSTRHFSKMELTLDQIREGIFLIDTLTENEQKQINVSLARVQEILEGDENSALKKINALLN